MSETKKILKELKEWFLRAPPATRRDYDLVHKIDSYILATTQPVDEKPIGDFHWTDKLVTKYGNWVRYLVGNNLVDAFKEEHKRKSVEGETITGDETLTPAEVDLWEQAFEILLSKGDYMRFDYPAAIEGLRKQGYAISKQQD